MSYAEYLFCVTQIEGNGDGRGEDEGAVLTFWKVTHRVASSVGGFQVPVHSTAEDLQQRIVFF